MGGSEKANQNNNGESKENFITGIIEEFYNQLLQYDIQYKDLYDMTIIEMENTLINKRKGLAYKIWRLSSFTHSPFVQNFPNNPKEAMPELYPVEKGIPMPDFLMKKAIERGVI